MYINLFILLSLDTISTILTQKNKDIDTKEKVSTIQDIR